MEAELTRAGECSSHVGGAFHSCHTMLSKHTEQVGQLSDRWRRILGQIDTRYVSLYLLAQDVCHSVNHSSSVINILHHF